MSYHKFSNLREIFQGDLTSKMMEGIYSRDYVNRPCNCNAQTLVKGVCPYKGKCCHKMLIYALTCNDCGKVYTGQTQDSLKERTNGHCQDVKTLVERGKKSDSFASHMAEHFEKGSSINAQQVRAKIKIDIIWQGNPINCMKSFKSFGCTLCNKEKCEIMKCTLKNENNTMNYCSEIYGACRHNSKFHRFINVTDTSTDDGQRAQKRVIKNKNKPSTKKRKKESDKENITRRANGYEKCKKSGRKPLAK